ncbi:MAG: IS4 family transposase [Lachnoclostridium sp.]|jgi:hypothetical protein|nr:IS4 family transposase [Lachnoclostridium sp.]
MQKTDQWKDQLSFYRFWQNDKVSESGLMDIATTHCQSQCDELSHGLLIEDTTEVRLENHRRRITDTTGLGWLRNKQLGFYCHPTLLVNASDHSLVGSIDIHLWHRDENQQSKEERKYKQQVLKDKESYRWSSCAIESKKKLASVKRLTVVQDREGDIYESFHLLKENGLDFVIRHSQNRKIVSSDPLKSKDYINTLSPIAEYELEIKGNNKKRKARMAVMEIRFGEVSICRPSNLKSGEYPDSIPLYLVQVKEKPQSVPSTEQAIEWTLYTSHPVTTHIQALEIVGYYQARWIIEDLFRTIKKEGVNYEASELETGPALRKLFIMSLMAAIQILQLRQARSGDTSQKSSLVFSKEQIECMQGLLPRFEGKTERLKNPFDQDNLAWATWIIARLGGWKGYSSQRPPGVITLHDGWVRFQTLFEGWNIAKDMYKH